MGKTALLEERYSDIKLAVKIIAAILAVFVSGTADGDRGSGTSLAQAFCYLNLKPYRCLSFVSFLDPFCIL